MMLARSDFRTSPPCPPLFGVKYEMMRSFSSLILIRRPASAKAHADTVQTLMRGCGQSRGFYRQYTFQPFFSI
jgi:hypothetical protein